MFIMPVIHHMSRYRQFDVANFFFRTKQYTLIGIICIIVAMYLGLGLALNSKVTMDCIQFTAPSLHISVSFSTCSHIYPNHITRTIKLHSNLIKSLRPEDYDKSWGISTLVSDISLSFIHFFRLSPKYCSKFSVIL